MTTHLLDKSRHNRISFDCGVDALNAYLRLTANQHASKDNTRTYVLEDQNDTSKIIGYYTLTMIHLDISSLPSNLQKRYAVNHSAGLIARLAVDKRFKDQGIGSWLLVDALLKLLKASELVAFPFVFVEAKEGVSAFYEAHGFKALKDEPDKLFMTIKSIRKSFTK